jgi:magnesium-dependent phosphatase 1
MGATSILVDKGINLRALQEGLTRFSENLKTTEKNKQKWLKKFSQNPNSSDKNA